MMIFLVDIADDVVVDNGVLAGAEVPRLLLGIVWSILEPLQLILKVEDVVSLLVTKSSVLILSEHFNHCLLLVLSNLFLTRWVSKCLCDWIVLHLLSLDELRGYFLVWFSLPLEVFLRRIICTEILFPCGVAVVQADSSIGLS